MHRLTLTITATNEVTPDAVLQSFAAQLQDVAEDLGALPAQNHSFGAFGAAGCKVYYRVEIDEPRLERAALTAAS